MLNKHIMNFSSAALLKLQRLARVVHKELQYPVHIRSKTGIGELLRRAASENQNTRVLEMYNDFVSTLTEQDRLELVSYNVSIPPGSNSAATEIKPGQTSQSEQKKSASPQYDRRQRDTHVDQNRRKKSIVYRGVTINNARRQQDLPYSGPDRRGRGEHQADNSLKEEEADSEQRLHSHEGLTYRGVAIEQEVTHQQSDKTKGKHTGMYRGQKIDYDDEN